MREKLNSLIYVLLRDSLTISDMERIVEEVEAGVKPDSGIIALAADHITESLCKSKLKCYDNMCNTEDDDVEMVITDEGQKIPMCADCRKRNPQAVIDNHIEAGV